MAIALEIPTEAGFKPHRLIGQEIAHSNARRQAEKKRTRQRKGCTTKFTCKLGGKAIKKYPETLLKWQPNSR